VCVGEGGSGGALAFGHADRLLMLDGAIFSVIGPEGAAAILERDVDKAPQVAERLKLTAPDLLTLGIVDGIVDDRDTIVNAVREAQAGDRLKRTDAATARWLR
jgi:acyl-CoA carboxylase subunit beta